MINLKMNFKAMLLVLLTIFTVTLFISCKSTPEELVVKSKAGDEFEEAIQKKSDADIVESTEVEHISKEIIGDMNITSVKVDADVFIPSTSKIPVADISCDTMSQDQLNKIVSVLTKNGKLYNPSIITYEMIEKNIIRIKKEANDLDSDLAQSNGIGTLSELQKLADEKIRSLEKQLSDAPSESDINIYVDSVDATSTVQNLKVDLGKDYDSLICYLNTPNALTVLNSQMISFADFGVWQGERKIESNYSQMVDDDIAVSDKYKKANEKAEDLIDAMGIENVSIINSYISKDSSTATNGETGKRIYNSNGEYYVFVFAREINQVPIVRAFHQPNSSDNEEPEFAGRMYNEVIELWIENDEVKQFIWGYPIKVDNIINDDVEIKIDLNKAVDLMSDRMLIKYNPLEFAGSEGAKFVEDVIIEVDRVELGLASLKKKNNDTGYLTSPVWDFYGKVRVKFTDEYMEKYYVDYGLNNLDENGYINDNANQYMSICTVNALDGTIINRALGY